MARTHHATRTFRLSCGCLRDYPGMATGKRHQVLCGGCGTPAETLYDYPDGDFCGTRGSWAVAGSTVHAQCTNPAGTIRCTQGLHHDKYLQADFTLRPRLTAGTNGEIGRA